MYDFPLDRNGKLNNLYTGLPISSLVAQPPTLLSDFVFRYRAGSSNPSDALSRRPGYEPAPNRDLSSLLASLGAKLARGQREGFQTRNGAIDYSVLSKGLPRSMKRMRNHNYLQSARALCENKEWSLSENAGGQKESV